MNDDPAKRATPESVERRPRIVVLCGSARFHEQFQEANFRLTTAGKIVLSIGFLPGAEVADKAALDELHKRKIDLADEVYVINVGGHLGESTRSEIDYAEAAGKPITYLEPPAPGR